MEPSAPITAAVGSEKVSTYAVMRASHIDAWRFAKIRAAVTAKDPHAKAAVVKSLDSANGRTSKRSA